MNKTLFVFCFALTALPALGQACTHSDLSKSLVFKTQPKRLKRTDGFDSCRVRITVVDKLSNHSVFTTILASGFLFTSAYATCEAARSYTTGAGQGTDVKDYDYGDLIVADFNFDGREDFAAKNDSGGNRGPTYKYYIQNSAGSFGLDKFLTELRWSGKSGHGESNFPLSWKQQNQPVNGSEPSMIRPFGPKQ
ncbi:MAG: hypothetical protein EOO58_03400, partial [Hymenobacter sp.]